MAWRGLALGVALGVARFRATRAGAAVKTLCGLPRSTLLACSFPSRRLSTTSGGGLAGGTATLLAVRPAPRALCRPCHLTSNPLSNMVPKSAVPTLKEDMDQIYVEFPFTQRRHATPRRARHCSLPAARSSLLAPRSSPCLPHLTLLCAPEP